MKRKKKWYSDLKIKELVGLQTQDQTMQGNSFNKENSKLSF